MSLENTLLLVAVTLASTTLSGAVGMGGGTLLVGTRRLRSATPRAFGLGFGVVLGLLALKLIAPVFP